MKEFVEKIFYFQNQLKLKHWQEASAYKHKLLGDYYDAISEEFDTLVECFISNENEITATETAFILINHIDIIETYQKELSKFLLGLRKDFELRSELVTLVDNILIIVSKYNYLLNKS
jgi:hypothetical protein